MDEPRSFLVRFADALIAQPRGGALLMILFLLVFYGFASARSWLDTERADRARAQIDAICNEVELLYGNADTDAEQDKIWPAEEACEDAGFD